ncbi:hypothetical protein HU200_026654 [Digitaria exilis]|uniref:Uncharacterized protein n=1 Tax=Digitaria exilis TaxID=1010633 RepID=A0A835BX20_9POAL|nr:hypothetical protein HU200_026654 [Digitaria exilis]
MIPIREASLHCLPKTTHGSIAALSFCSSPFRRSACTEFAGRAGLRSYALIETLHPRSRGAIKFLGSASAEQSKRTPKSAIRIVKSDPAQALRQLTLGSSQQGGIYPPFHSYSTPVLPPQARASAAMGAGGSRARQNAMRSGVVVLGAVAFGYLSFRVGFKPYLDQAQEAMESSHDPAAAVARDAPEDSGADRTREEADLAPSKDPAVVLRD